MKVQRTLAAVLAAIVVTLGLVAPVAASARVPKVALIVGPVGSLTDSYRALANDAAAAARDAGAAVVKVYSPNATWPAVRAAITGASIVVYLGHGNGWPSPYRDALFPPSQDGFGLNPVAGVDDTAHQYFGEASVATVRLAPNAVVLLSHLCYASGNSEPGLPEGSVDTATQRVDNYAAGFLRAGARAVVAEGHMGPAWYVRQLLTTRASIESIWARSPSAHGHTFRVASVRSPGYVERLDPDTASSGFYRSLVSRGVTAGDLQAGASATPGQGGTPGPPPVPTLSTTSVRFGNAQLAALPIAGTKTRVTIPVAAGSVDLIPKGAEVSVRWDPILLDAAVPAPAASADPGASPAGSADPGASPGASPSAAAPPAPSPAAAASPAGSAMPTPAASTPSGSAASAPPSPASPDASATSSRGPAASPSVDASPAAATASPEPVAAPTASPAPLPAIPDEPPAVDLVVPERLGSVVDPLPASRTAHALRVAVTYPTEPGLYRLVTMLHAPSGIAYDAATQAMLTPVLVRVGGPFAVAYGAPPALTLLAGTAASIPVRVVNAGSEAWDQVVTTPPSKVAGEALPRDRTSRVPATLSGTWVSTTSGEVPAASSLPLDPAVAAPGGTVAVSLDVVAPAAPGDYLLLLDVVSPARGPLSALGSAPALIRVTVVEPVVAPTATPPQRVG